MIQSEVRDIRNYLLKWLIPSLLGLLCVVLIFHIRVSTFRNFEGQAYIILISALIVLGIGAYYCNLKEKTNLASIVIFLMAFLGAWGAVYIDGYDGIESFFPLAYLTIPVIFSSLLFPVYFSVILSIIQFTSSVILITKSEVLLNSDWESFIAYILLVFVLSIVTTALIKLQLRQLKESAIKDHLTGLFNRRYFDVTLESRVKRGHLKNLQFGIILLDIDNFKTYNDTYGHDIGDFLLSLIAQFLLDEVGLSDSVCRYGGDEFALIIPQTTSEELYELAERLRLTNKRTPNIHLDSRFENITTSIGVALFPLQGKTGNELIARADENLLIAKDLGKDKVVFQ